MDFSESQIVRYGRHILLPELGGIGQAKLLNAKVLVVGAGGLGSPLILYLAAAGVGTIGIVDDDAVELSNLQRQVLHTMAGIGQPKVTSARDTIARLTDDVTVIPFQTRLTPENAAEMLGGWDVIADGSDNFPTRFLLNDTCRHLGKTLVSAAILRFEGQLTTFKPGGPCYRCIFPAPPPADDGPTCSQAGVLGSVAGMLGTMQATEVIKEITGIGESMAGRLLIADALTMNFRTIRVPKDPQCPVCGHE